MNTVRNKKTLRASAIGAAAAVSLSTLLYASAGTAQAETNPTYFANQDGSLEVIYGGGGMAVYATIVDAHNPPGATEVCHYHSVGVMNTPALPYDRNTTVTGPSPSAPLTIIFPALGTYGVDVTCDGTGNSASYSPVVY
ncbi:MAG: hypothetical protein WAN71_25375 [Mycobacterium sp.]|uniref:hypothetical protein n=1 Tax=Mycobacterium sp. TaxID=1785 RepID=UPI003BAEC41E